MSSLTTTFAKLVAKLISSGTSSHLRNRPIIELGPEANGL